MEWRSPPDWCYRVCNNALSQACAEVCAVKRDCSWFELKQTELPTFPLDRFIEEMTDAEQRTIIAIYLFVLTGGNHATREISYGKRSLKNLEALKINRLLYDSKETTTPHSDNGKACVSERIRPPQMGGGQNGEVK